MALQTKFKLEFAKPQINEIVFGVGLQLKKFDATFFGRFYDRIKNEYVMVSQRPPIILFDKSNINHDTFFNPRILFETSDKLKLIQMQSDRFHYNWRKQEQEQNQYPGFEEVYKQFKTAWNSYNSWLKEENAYDDSIVNRLELTYINHIDKGELWQEDINDIDRVINFFKKLNIEKRYSMNNFNTTFSFPLEEDGELVYAIRSGVKRSTKESVLVIDLTMKKKCSANENFDSWFTNAHDHIAKVLISSLSKEALKEWGYKKI